MNATLTKLRAEFRHVTDERDFRNWSFREMRDRAQIAVLVVSLLVFAGVLTDMASLGAARALLLTVPVRSAFLAFGLFQFVRLRRMTRVDSVERAVTILQVLLFAVFYYLVYLSYLSDAQHLLVAVATVLVAYLVFPNPFVTMVRLASFGSLGYAIAVALFPGLNLSMLTLVMPWLVIGNVFGAVTAHQLHVTKRREYMRLIEQRRLNEELRSLNVELEALATTDSLTGINNRRNFFNLAADEMSRAKRYRRPLTALMIDIDEFKQVNDAHGHAVGDAVIKAVAQACITTLRETDVLGRLGGDEFALLLPETDDGREQAERLRATVERLRTTLGGGSDLMITVSIGVAPARRVDGTIDHVLARADEALYEAKQSGRNRVATR